MRRSGALLQEGWPHARDPDAKTRRARLAERARETRARLRLGLRLTEDLDELLDELVEELDDAEDDAHLLGAIEADDAELGELAS